MSDSIPGMQVRIVSGGQTGDDRAALDAALSVEAPCGGCAAVVAERLGHNPDEALTLGPAVAVLNTWSKGRHLGLIKPAEKPRAKAKTRRQEQPRVEVCGRAMPVERTPDQEPTSNQAFPK